MHSTHLPLTFHELVDCLSRFPLESGQRVAATLHLATDTTSVVGISIRQEGSVWTWRGGQVDIDERASIEDIAETVVSFCSNMWRDGDVRVDPTGHCLKPIRSGAHTLIAGSFLYGGGELLVDGAVPDPVSVGVAWLTRGDEPARAGVITHRGETYIVQPGPGACIIHSTSQHGDARVIHEAAWGADEVCDLLRDTLTLDDIEAATIGSRVPDTTDIDFVGSYTIDGSAFDVIIPATLGRGLVLGAPHGAAVPARVDPYTRGERDAWSELLRDWDPIEPARFEPGWVARHRVSGIYAILRARPPE